MFKRIFLISISLFFLNVNGFAKSNKWILEKKIVDEIQGETISSIMRVYSQTLSYQYPKNWPLNPIYRNQRENHYIVEYIPENQELKTWKDMFTIQGFENAKYVKDMTAEKLIGLLKDSIASQSPGQLYYKEIYKGNINKYRGIIVLMGLKKIVKTIIPELSKGVGEIGLYLGLDGINDIYVIHRSWKSIPYSEEKLPMDEKELNKWINYLKSIKLINPVEENIEGSKTGIEKEYYDDKKTLRYEWNYKDGQLHGESKEYEKNGKLKRTMMFINGKLKD